MKKGFIALALLAVLGVAGAYGASARESWEGPRHGGDDRFERRFFDESHRDRRSGDDDSGRFFFDDRGRHGDHHFFEDGDDHRGRGRS